MKKNVIRLAKLAAVACVLTSTFAMAQTGKGGRFTIHNDTAKNTVVGFYTNDGSGWSTNWLREQLKPGETASAQFKDATGNCNQRLQVGWLGSKGGEVKDDPIRIDICKASNVYLHDNDVSFD